MMIMMNGKKNIKNNLKNNNNRMMIKRSLNKSIHSQKKGLKEFQRAWFFQKIMFLLAWKMGKNFIIKFLFYF